MEKNQFKSISQQKNKNLAKDPFLEDNRIVFNKYKIIKKLNRGSFGNVYSVVRLTDKMPFAMKVEKRSKVKQFLLKEVYCLLNIKGFGIPKLISCGRNKDYNILIETF